MTLSSFLLWTLITGLILLIIRIFWLYLFILVYVLQLIGMAFFSMLVWCAFITVSSEGWGWVWLYFFLFYTGLIAVYAGIILDAYGHFSTLLRKILK